MRKVFCLILIIIAGVLIYKFGFNNQNIDNKDRNGLIDLGFDKSQAISIESKFSEEVVDKLVSLQDKDVIYEMINTENFDSDKLDNYITFYNQNKKVNISNIIKLVNNDVDKIPDLEYDDILVNLIDDDYYIYDNTMRYVNYYHNSDDLAISDIIRNVNSNLDYDFYTNTMSTNLDYGNLILVNKYYRLDDNYEPSDLVYIDSPYSYRGGYLRKETYDAFMKMVDASFDAGIELYSVSPYRSYQTQLGLYNRYVSYDGVLEADTYSARAGFSEHQTGLAVDINSTDDSFAFTNEAKWLVENAYKFGFILRYPKGKEYITGYQYEPWHYRYVGIEVATKIYNLNITFEEYYAFYVEKKGN